MKNYNDWGLFRFSLIAPLINNTHGYDSKEAYIRDVSAKKHEFKGKEYTFSSSCIRNWYFKYKKSGYKALEIKKRKDYKSSRKLNNETIQRIITLREEFPTISGTSIYKKLLDEHFISKCDISLNTVLRFIKSNNLKSNQNISVDRRMFEMKSVNDCWQSDTSFGPYVTIDDKKYRTKLIMFIDDKSRMIMGYEFFLNDNAINMQKVFKNAVKTYGIPKKLFVDNGSSFDNKQLSFICASLGVELIHAKPYSPESKAKIERTFRTIKDGWMRCTNWNNFKSLSDVNESLKTFIYNEYINKIHSSTNETPNQRWHNEFKNIRFLDEKFIDDAFMHRIIRTVRNDRTVKINNDYYEVPFKYIRQNIELRYDPNDLSKMYIFDNDKMEDICTKVDKQTNSIIKRNTLIDYSKIVNDERNVIDKDGD